jgi:hypothetical protein
VQYPEKGIHRQFTVDGMLLARAHETDCTSISVFNDAEFVQFRDVSKYYVHTRSTGTRLQNWDDEVHIILNDFVFKIVVEVSIETSDYNEQLICRSPDSGCGPRRRRRGY